MNIYSTVHRSRRKQGFTLIELLVVIAILGLIAALAIPRAEQVLGSTKTKTDAANQSIIQTAVERYFLDNSAYPTTADGRVDFTKLVPDYLRAAPKTNGTPDTNWYVDAQGNVSRTAPATN